jgi:MFS family permease
MKDKRIIVLTSFLAVLICLIITLLLFYAVTPKLLVVLAFIVGIVTGVCITALIYHLADIIKTKRSEGKLIL